MKNTFLVCKTSGRALASIILTMLWTGLLLSPQSPPPPNASAEGQRFYKLANQRLKEGKEKEELSYLLEAYRCYDQSAGSGHSEDLAMSYLLYMRIRTHRLANTPVFNSQIPVSFPHAPVLEEYVKTHKGKGFSDISNMDLFSGSWAARRDKIRLLEELKVLTANLRKQARLYIAQAQDLREQANLSDAIALLRLSLSSWTLDETLALLQEYERLFSQQTVSQKEIEQAVSQKKFRDADAILKKNFREKLLPGDYFSASGTSIKQDWSQTLLHEAELYYRKKQLDLAMEYCEQSLEIHNSERGEKLRSQIARRQKSLYISATVTNPGDFQDSGGVAFKWSGNSSHLAQTDDLNTLSAGARHNQPSWGVNASYMFSLSHGAGIAVSRGSQDWKYFTSYAFKWLWLTDDKKGQSASSRATMSENAKATLTLIHFYYIFRKHLAQDLYARFTGGPVIYFTSADFYARLGYGGIWALPNGSAVEEWFPFQYRINDSGVGMGFAIGGGIEYHLPPIALFIDYQYHFLYIQKLDWRLVNKPYSGGSNKLSVGDPSALDHLPIYRMTLNYSQPRIVAGVRFFLF